MGLTWPEPKSSAAGSRMMQLITLFKAKGWSITFATAAQITPYSEDLKKLGIDETAIYPNTEEASQILKAINPDIVLFDQFTMEEQFGWRVAESCPDAIRILDTEDLHFLRKARRKAIKEKREMTQSDIYSETAKREIASILRCDLSLMISKVEYDLLINQFNISQEILWYLPFLLTPIKDRVFEELPQYQDRQDFMFVGNFLHPPNYDAVLYLKTYIWSLIHKRLPQAKLNIYGAYTSRKVKQLENKNENFIVKGRTENLEKTFQNHRILLAPLRFGAGLKGKFIDAMRNGTPSITTPFGEEGLSGKLPFSGVVANSPEEITKAAEALYQDKNDWKTAQLNCLIIVNTRFDKKRFTVNFFKKIKRLNQNLKTHREANFVGQILMHHRQQSTKYMSRWIETKNKVKK